MSITGGFGMQFCVERQSMRYWYLDESGVKRWHDNGQPVEGEVLKANADLVPSRHVSIVGELGDYFKGSGL